MGWPRKVSVVAGTDISVMSSRRYVLCGDSGRMRMADDSVVPSAVSEVKE